MDINNAKRLIFIFIKPHAKAEILHDNEFRCIYVNRMPRVRILFRRFPIDDYGKNDKIKNASISYNCRLSKIPKPKFILKKKKEWCPHTDMIKTYVPPVNAVPGSGRGTPKNWTWRWWRLLPRKLTGLWVIWWLLSNDFRRLEMLSRYLVFFFLNMLKE